MHRIKNAVKTLGEVADAIHTHNEKINNMTSELLRRGNNIDPASAKEIARVLVYQAEVTWK